MLHRLKTVAIALGVAASTAMSTAAFAQTDLKFTLDWKFEGPSAPFLVAIDKGHYKDVGLDVTIDTGAGSLESIPRVASAPMTWASATSIR